MRVLTLLILLAGASAHAELFQGPLSASMAGSGRAGIDGSEGAFLNPALVPLQKNYEIDAYFRDGEADLGQHRHAYGLGVGDNTPDVLFPGAINYIRTRDTGRAAGATDGELWHMAIGRNVGGKFAFGVSGYRLSSKVQNDREYVQWNYSLGVLLILGPDMGLAYVLNNLAKPGSEVPHGLRQDLQQGFGFFASVFNVARLHADIVRNEVDNPQHRLVYMLGAENLSGEFAIFRLGFKRDDERNQNYVTAGACLNGPRLKIDYSFEKNVRGVSGALHSVDIRLPF